MKTVSVAKIKNLMDRMYKEHYVDNASICTQNPQGLAFYEGAIFACKQLLAYGVDKKAKK